MGESESDRNVEKTRAALAKKLDSLGWGVFFVWMGIAFLTNVGWAVGIVGVGVIALGAQAARKYFGLPVERFWLIIGSLFIVWGVWRLLKIQLEAPIARDVLPILFIVVGIVIVVSAFLRKPPQ